MNTAITLETPDYEAVKVKQQSTWAAGDYAKIGSTLQITGELLCESMALKAGQSVLDVAAGNGNASLAAARRFCQVLSTDYVPSLLEQGKQRSDANGFPIKYEVADVENLPYDENQFENVVSTFGAMFAPDQKSVVSELIRVCKPGGKIGLVNWTPESFIGQLFKVIGQYISPPAGLSSPMLWGTKEFIEQNFSNAAQEINIVERDFIFNYESAEHWIDVFRTYYGPTHKVFEALNNEKQEQLRADIITLIEKNNLANDGKMYVPSSYLEIVIKKKQ
jgi:ubiquinone/menaquinone biosynthesis C-methylase UbiE